MRFCFSTSTGAAGSRGHRLAADERLALGIEDRLDRQISRIELRIIINLPIVLADRLLEITFSVKQADADEPNSQVAG